VGLKRASASAWCVDAGRHGQGQSAWLAYPFYLLSPKLGHTS
jgi:hypothetical protein